MDIKVAHQFCTNNQKAISKSKNCGCFYCMKIFPASEVEDFLAKENTALCPKCNIDSVICDKDVDFDEQFLQKMNEYWF